MDAITALKGYYESYDEDGRLRSRHGMVEYLTTMRYIEKYLRPGMQVAEIGAGTGRYTLSIAAQGYQVDAVELVEHNLSILRQGIKPGMAVNARQGNATDLSAFEDESFDITLLLGPMYHLFTQEDQKKALSEAIRVTKKGGVIFAAYCGNDATVLQFCFGKGMLLQPRYRQLVDPVTFKAAADPQELFVLYRREDIDALMEGFAVERLHYVGSDMATNHMREVIDTMSDELFEDYLRYHFSTCERTDMVGISHHILDVFRREG